MNGGESPTVILKRDPNKDGNVFGGSYPLYFYYFTTSGSSKLTLEKDPNLNTDMSYFIQGDMQVSGNSHLIMNLDSTDGYGRFKLDGRISADGSTIEIKDVNTFDIQPGGSIQVEDGGTLNINNVDTVMSKSSGNAFSILNNNSTLYIDADVYNYDKDTSTGGGYFRQTGENAETTIEGSFYNAGFKSDYVIIYEALVEIIIVLLLIEINNYALNTKSKFASLASDYKPYYVDLEEQESNNVYISALAGYSNYKSSSGSEFGASFGYDKEIEDDFFGGFYASISKSYINTEGMN